MKKTLAITLMFLSGLLMAQPSGWAEMIRGIVSSLDLGANSISLMRTDQITGNMKELKITIRSDAELEGISSLSELQPGDEIRLDASKTWLLGSYEAKKIEAVKNESKVQPAEEKPAASPLPSPKEGLPSDFQGGAGLRNDK